MKKNFIYITALILFSNISIAQNIEELSGFGEIHGAYNVSATVDQTESTPNYDAFLPFLEAEKEERKLLEDNPFSATFSLLNRRSDRKEAFSLSKSKTTYEINDADLTVKLHQCLANAENQTGNDIAFVEVIYAPTLEGEDARVVDREGDQILFSGWMYSSFPSANQFEHASYSLKLISCEEKDLFEGYVEERTFEGVSSAF